MFFKKLFVKETPEISVPFNREKKLNPNIWSSRDIHTFSTLSEVEQDILVKVSADIQHSINLHIKYLITTYNEKDFDKRNNEKIFSSCCEMSILHFIILVYYTEVGHQGTILKDFLLDIIFNTFNKELEKKGINLSKIINNKLIEYKDLMSDLTLCETGKFTNPGLRKSKIAAKFHFNLITNPLTIEDKTDKFQREITGFANLIGNNGVHKVFEYVMKSYKLILDENEI
jgi:hypothetical protein